MPVAFVLPISQYVGTDQNQQLFATQNSRLLAKRPPTLYHLPRELY
jgi:hypothetical protein